MNLRSLALPLVFAAAVLFAYFFTDLGPWSSELLSPASTTVSYSDEYESHSLAFTDAVRGYSIRYPVGYPLEVEDGKTALFFAPGPSGLSETFVFQVVNGTYTLEELKDIAFDELAVPPDSETVQTVDGRRILRLQYRIAPDEFGETLHMVQGLVPCGDYSLYFVASIPESLKDDISLADYSLYSAKCGPSTPTS
ncbi:hypothetical protein HYV43_06110 [Candidatus Micrarchaeota archaeon]|nr:hypothetical protein [Candidatus Micrarchaeota archaeon]